MSMQDTLADALSHIMNCEKSNKTYCYIQPVSKMIKEVFKVMQDAGYIGEYEFIDDNCGGKIKLNLLGKINSCGAIKPRFNYQRTEIEKYEKRFLPAKDFGLIIVTTPKGVMTHIQAKNKKIGGRLLSYVY